MEIKLQLNTATIFAIASILFVIGALIFMWAMPKSDYTLCVEKLTAWNLEENPQNFSRARTEAFAANKCAMQLGGRD